MAIKIRAALAAALFIGAMLTANHEAFAYRGFGGGGFYGRGYRYYGGYPHSYGGYGYGRRFGFYGGYPYSYGGYGYGCSPYSYFRSYKCY